MAHPGVARLVAGIVGLLLVAPAAAGSLAPSPRREESRIELAGAVDADATEAFLASQSEGRDPSGRAGSNVRVVVHHGSGRSAHPGRASSRLYRTGYLGLEPTLGVLRDGTVYVTGITRTEAAGRGAITTRVLKTRSGSAFQDVSPVVAGVVTHNATQDEYLYAEPRTGHVFLSDYVGCGEISGSGDGGRTWSAPGLSCSELADHQSLFGGHPVTSTPSGGYPEVLYYCASSLVALEGFSTSAGCTKSTDGGMTWAPTGALAWTPTPYTPDEGELQGLCNGLIGHGTTGPDGTVYLPKNCDEPNLLVSHDEGASWTRIRVPTRLGVTHGPLGIPDHEAAVAVDARGTIYVGWVARDRKPYLTTSRDGGRHWSRPRDVAPPGVNETAQPALAVTPGGRVAFSYMGTRTSPGRPFPNDSSCPLTSTTCANTDGKYHDTVWSAYITVSDDATAPDPWFTSAPLSDPDDDPLTKGSCDPLRCQQQYDFGDVQLGPDGTPWVSRVDGCNADWKCVPRGELVLGRLVGLSRHS